ncbi:exported protein of unknown function [Candidatus Saccharimonas aalborgensis]|uniref:Uncharacterized protein n=2 Tax=Candidatus Saccharimonas aalborgensis TaxID=1332188 RepID=R4PW22_9BACT|nr:exported protein of unknown function [Candidatus Saccharimonas aalborgensis]
MTMQTIKRVVLSLVIAAAPFFVVSPVSAAVDTCTWTGAVDNTWSNGGNWTGCDNAGVPENGDALTFPEVANNKSMNNDLVGLSVTGLSFTGTGYTVGGNAFSISTVTALDATESVTINADITYTAFNASITPSAGKTVTINGVSNFTLGGGEVNIGGSGRSGTVDFYGNITGTAAQLVAVSGATAVVRGAANTYTAATVGAESNAHFVCRSLTCFGDNANDIYSGGGVVELHTTGTYVNNIQTSVVTPDTSSIWAYDDVTLNGAITVNDGLYFGQGTNGKTLAVDGDVNLAAEDLQISGMSRAANVVINGVVSGNHSIFVYSSTLTLAGTNTYTGATYATSNNATIEVTNQSGLGTSGAGTQIGDGDSLEFNFASAQTVSEPLYVMGTGVSGTGAVVQTGASTTLSGAIALAGDTTFGVDSNALFSAFMLSGVISGTGNITVTTSPTTVVANSSIQFTGASPNTYTGKLTVQGVRFYPSKAASVVAVTGDMDVLASASKPSTVETAFSESIADTSHVHLVKDGSNKASLSIGSSATETIGYVTGDGELSVGANGAAVVLTSNADYTFSGTVSKFSNFPAGDSFVVKKGTGTATLTGGLDTSYIAGVAPVFGAQEGSLILNGVFTEAGTQVLSGATLKGTGTVGAVTVDNGGAVSVGNSPGCMTFGSLTLNSGSTYTQEISGTTACTQYDQATVTGAAVLGNATLATTLSTNPADGTVFTILTAASVSGTFNGLPDGATVNVNGVTLRINYTATSVTLTKVGGNLAPTGSSTAIYGLLGLCMVLLSTLALRRYRFNNHTN